jgi:hypothetical protein
MNVRNPNAADFLLLSESSVKQRRKYPYPSGGKNTYKKPFGYSRRKQNTLKIKTKCRPWHWHNPCGSSKADDIAVSPSRSENQQEKGGD